MPVRSNSDRRYYRRFLLMGIGALGFALWSLYDGAINYPNQRERGLAYETLGEEQQKNGWDSLTFQRKWEALAAERGWPPTYPGEPKTDIDIGMQYAMAALTGTLGLWLLFGVWRTRGQWIESTDTGFTSSWGQSFNFDQVTSVDKFRWQKKGIAKIFYQDGGRNKKFVLDDFKFERHAADQMLYELEGQIDPNLITGGPLEPTPGEQGEEPAEQFAGEPEHTN